MGWLAPAGHPAVELLPPSAKPSHRRERPAFEAPQFNERVRLACDADIVRAVNHVQGRPGTPSVATSTRSRPSVSKWMVEKVAVGIPKSGFQAADRALVEALHGLL